MQVHPANAILRWSKAPDSGRLDELTQVELPRGLVGGGYAFSHEGWRWRVTGIGNAKAMGFPRVPSTHTAVDCDPVGPLAEEFLKPPPL